MSTRSLIGKERENNQVEYVYCHFDGYVEGGVGDTLTAHYNSDNVEELLKNGDMSSLDYTVSDCVFYKDRGYIGVDSAIVNKSDYFSKDNIGWSEYRYLFDKDSNLICYDVYDGTQTKLK